MPIAVIVLLVTYVGNEAQMGAGTEQTDAAIRQRISPVATIELIDINAPLFTKLTRNLSPDLCCMSCGRCGGRT